MRLSIPHTEEKFAHATYLHVVHIRANLLMVLLLKVDTLSPESTDIGVPLTLRYHLRFRDARRLLYGRTSGIEW